MRNRWQRLVANGLLFFVSIAVIVSVIFGSNGAALSASSRSSGDSGQVEVIHELHHDLSRPLRDISPIPPTTGELIADLPVPFGQVISNGADPAVQNSALAAPGPSTGLNFDGIGYGLPNPNNVFIAGIPDTNGAVGESQYVQSVNSSFAVFDKHTGALEQAPVDNGTLWSGFPGDCHFGGGDQIRASAKVS